MQEFFEALKAVAGTAGLISACGAIFAFGLWVKAKLVGSPKPPRPVLVVAKSGHRCPACGDTGLLSLGAPCPSCAPHAYKKLEGGGGCAEGASYRHHVFSSRKEALSFNFTAVAYRRYSRKVREKQGTVIGE